MADWLFLFVLVGLLVACYRPLGDYMARVYTSERDFKVERVIYRLTGVDPRSEQTWPAYAVSVVAFSAISVVFLFLLQRVQSTLPLSNGMKPVTPALAFNTAASFVTNTNWQNYAGESTMGAFVQMGGLAVQNFLSAAAGMAVAVAVIRGLARSRVKTLGNFWVDLVRTTVRILLPACFVVALLFVSQGMIQNLHDPATVHTLGGGTQVIPGGPVASQEAIKELGTNGGGFFNANSAHPFENPSGVTNLLEIFLLLVIPFALTGTFGKMIGDRRQGYVLALVMFALWFGSALVVWHFESQPNPHLPALAVDGNMTGKEVRFGVPPTAMFAASTTGTSTGSVNGSMDSLTPLAGGVPLTNIMLSEVTPGGTGSGLFGMLVMAIVAVFVAGLMVGRTPEYLGKKIEPRDMKLVTLYILLVPALTLIFTGVALALPSARASILNRGPHGLTEILYSFTSQANNNGSAFGGLAANTTFFNIAGGMAMLIGRLGSIVLVLALAGSLATKKPSPPSLGTFPTTTPLFGVLLGGVIVIVTALVYFPALSLGPLVEGLAR